MRKLWASAPPNKEELLQLKVWALSTSASRALALRARIVLDCLQGRSHREIAHELKVTEQTVGKWRSRFRTLRLGGLTDRPRIGAPRRLNDAIVQRVVQKTLQGRQTATAQWTSRALALEVGISQSAVLRIWRTFGITPHRRAS